RFPSVPYVLPFAVFLLVLGVRNTLPISPVWEYPLRIFLTVAAILLVSRGVFSWKPVAPVGSVSIGILVFLIWIAPDLISPAYRQHWLFQNSITGRVASSIASEDQWNFQFLIFRILGSTLVVPIIEELFWRGWLMRYIISSDFRSVPLGT